ncbi:MAG: 50S ribosome-binding GTPase [Gammaproteobacteria bacterium]|nr:50S ribosome-binding GTPase [Gammaproteobacteria bacterium]MCP5415651.1 50S ribosome-binding GTPase [Chromatiaceae bacterium]
MHYAFQQISEFLKLLQQRERQFAPPDADAGDRLPTLIFANAMLRNAIQRQREWPLPPQLAVIGPTQSGKSSVVNLLLGKPLAEASPLAGYTRFAHGFANREMTPAWEGCLQMVMPGWEQVEAHSQGEGALYSLTRTSSDSSFTELSVIVWDTADFDSVGSRKYRDTVPEICALADLLLLVVSREKYADRSVWRLLRLIAPLGIPLVICVNKTEPGDEGALIAALDKRLQAESIAPLAIQALPYLQRAAETLADSAAARTLRARLSRFLGVGAPTESRSPQRLVEYLNDHWSQWTGPVRREQLASNHWEEAVVVGIAQALAGYQRECQEKPHYSYALRRAVLGLLELLEIPGIAAALTKARSVLTWPARRLQAFFQKRLTDKGAGGQDQEAIVLREAVAHLLIGLQRRVSEARVAEGETTHSWWRELSQLLNQQSEHIKDAAEQAVTDYQAVFQKEIEEASQRLYLHLQQHPRTLYGLRAARATTDAAAIVLAVKTGGLGINDLILTPAMLAVTSLLAEGAVGGYMKQVEAELKERQVQLLKQLLFQQVLTERLLHLPRTMPADHCYAISADLMEQAEQSLSELVRS